MKFYITETFLFAVSLSSSFFYSNVNAFAPPAPSRYQHQRNFVTTSFTSTTSTTVLFTATQNEEGTVSAEAEANDEIINTGKMTREDEQVLFGETSTRRDPPYPLRHRKKDRSGNILVDKSLPINPLDHSSTNPLINKLHTMREQTLQSCPQLWFEVSKFNPNQIAIIDDHLCDSEKISLTFSEMKDIVERSALAFQRMGVTKKGMNVAVFAENSARWLMVDHGIQLAGGVSAVRGADAPLDELRYIYHHSDSAGIVVLQGPKLLYKLHKDAMLNHAGGDKFKGIPLGLSNESHGPVKNIILMHKEKSKQEDIDTLAKELGVTIEFFPDLIATNVASSSKSSNLSNSFPKLTRDDLSTIVYTSGTTGRPKGVMLTHGNLLHQVTHRLAPSKPYEETEPLPNETMVSLLPVWHITERTFELWMLSRSCKVVYSSIRTFRNDMAKHKPEWLVLVPRVLEKIAAGVQDKFSSGSPAVKALSSLFTKTSSIKAVHSKIVNGLVDANAMNNNNGNNDDISPPGFLEKLASRAILTSLAPINAIGDKLVWKKVQDGFGGNLKTIISGGSALAGGLEKFYEAAGIQILVGYGLTECSPLLAYRRKDANLVVAGCCGKPCTDTEVRVVDPNSKSTSYTDRPSLPIGQVGVVLGRGPQVMKGYYKDPDATAKAIDAFGWFDTGDLGRINPITGDLILTGRAKDTIVLSNGENIEPQPIEDAILGGSSLVEQVMLTGQDGRRLVAIVVLSPTELANAGFLSSSSTEKFNVEKLQAANEIINDPKCTMTDWEENAKVLNDVASKLRLNNNGNGNLQAALMADIKQATKDFRKWEQVGAVHFTLEPFAMVNGQLTQSYKVKRASVMERYENELPK